MRQKWLILGVFIAVVAATAFITLSMTKIYEATATLEYDPNPSRPLGSEVEDVAIPTGNFLATKEWYQTQNAIISSRTIALRVVDRLNLHRDPEFIGVPPEQRDRWRGATRDEAAKVLMESLKVKQERETRVARIDVQSANPERAAVLANAVADAYLDWMMEERLGSTVRAVEWLSGQLDDITQRLNGSEHALYDFRRKNNVLSVSMADQQNGIAQTMQNFGNALAQTTTKRIQVEAKLRELESALADDPMQVHVVLVSENRAIAELREKYYEATVERDSMSAHYGPNHPEMLRINRRIATLVSGARAEISGLVDSVRGELREVKEVERGLRQARQQTQNQGLDLNLHEIDYNRLERTRANNEKLHSLLLQRTTETNLTRLLRVSPVRMVDRAVVPVFPIRPRTLLNLAAGCLLGLLAGFGAAVLRTRMDSSVTVPDDVIAAGGTLLGLIPNILNDSGKPYQGLYYGRRRQRRSGPDRVPPEAKDLIVHSHPRSSVAECCRTIRTNLAFMSPDKPLKTFVVTSPNPTEGKSTVAISLAVTFAQSGRRTLLADTDLRRPRVHRAFKIPSLVGATSVLAGESKLEDAFHETVVEGLYVLPCGPIPPNPSELLHSGAFSRLLKEMSEHFDVVVLDSPPVGVVIDAAILGPQVDGAIMVAKSGRTSRDALSHSLRQMRDVGSNMLGCVLNDIDLSRHSDYGGYYYYRGDYTYSSDQTGGSRGGGDGGAKPSDPNDPAPTRMTAP
jgi:capsular exopolysaccharide synthesis family protein